MKDLIHEEQLFWAMSSRMTTPLFHRDL